MKKQLILVFIFLLSCSSSGSDSEQEVQSDLSKISTCGVVVDKKLSENIPTGELVRVEVVDTEHLSISKFSTPNTNRLIKLHGISSDGVNNYKVLYGIDLLKKSLSGGAYFVSAGEDCLEQGTNAILGQIFTPDGANINEALIREGAAIPSPETCSGDLLAQCYNSIPVTSRPPADAELDLQDVNIASRCGAVKESNIVNPVTKAELVTVKAISADSVIITRKTGIEAGKSQLVKLHGLTTYGLSNTANAKAVEYLNTNSNAYLVVASQNCEITVNNGPGVAGQLYTSKGTSINEELISKGYALSTEDFCGGEQIYSCYREIQATAPIIQDPVLPDEEQQDDGSVINGYADYIDNFLWKPISDSDGKLAVLANPYDTKIVVTGNVTETLRHAGSGNGRGTTGRGKLPGCSYGNNVKVEFYNNEGKLVPLKDGRTSVTIADGCRRVEFRL